MRKVVYSVGVSLDGYIAAPDGSIGWLNRVTSKAKDEDFGMAAFFKSIDTVLLGRKTYEISLKLGMDESGFRKMKHYVFSRTLPPGERDGVEFVSAEPADFVANLKSRPGKDIWLCGGGELAREFINAKVLDEIVLGVTPVLVGAGIPAFPPEFAETPLDLIECKQFRGEVIGLTYRIAGAQASSAPKRTAKKTAKKKGSAKKPR